MDSSALFLQLSDILNSIAKAKLAGKATGITAKDVLLLALSAYALVGSSLGVIDEYEGILKVAFANAMKAASARANPKAIQTWVDRSFQQLRQAGEARNNLTKFRCS